MDGLVAPPAQKVTAKPPIVVYASVHRKKEDSNVIIDLGAHSTSRKLTLEEAKEFHTDMFLAINTLEKTFGFEHKD